MADEPVGKIPVVVVNNEMRDGYDRWLVSPQVLGLRLALRAEFPRASELELRNHILHYTQIKLTAWLLPPDEEEDTEPWRT